MIMGISDIAEAAREGSDPIEPAALLGVSQQFERHRARLHHEGHGNPYVEAVQQVRKALSIPDEEAMALGKRLHGDRVSVLDYTREIVGTGRGSYRYAIGILFAGLLQNEQNRQMASLESLSAGTHDVCRLGLPGPTTDITARDRKRGARRKLPVGDNFLFLYKNRRDNYARLLQPMSEQIPYDSLHRKGVYLFTNATKPTPFADTVIKYANGTPLIKGKHVLELGAGNAIDPEHYIVEGGAESVTVIDSSKFIIERLQVRKGAAQPAVRKKLNIPEPTDMFEALEHYGMTEQRFDTVASHSSSHYFDDPTFERLCQLVWGVLPPNGHWALSVKAPGAVLDGNGIPLVQEVEGHEHLEDAEFVRKRAWMNDDGQVRWFRDELRWEDKFLKKFFHVRHRGVSQIKDYEAPGQGYQKFYVFICEPKTEAERRSAGGSGAMRALARAQASEPT